ncbi:MAG: DUF3089 domain-containing protein [Candidatus Geothermincolia bacterium]
MKKFTEIGVVLVAITAVVGLAAGCGSSAGGRPSTSAPATTPQGNPNFANSSNWLALPAGTTKKVDVFYLSDTTYQKADANAPNIGSIDDPKMQAGAKVALSKTATAFDTVADIYAPYNRQVDAQYKSTLPIPQQLSLEAGVPTTDAVNAFDYYIKNLNHGRPFILAGHSQGSNLLANLLSGYMKKNPELYKRMVAAYVIGYSITSDYLAQNSQLRFAQGPDDTGVIISYNTEAPVMHGTNPVTMPGGVAINPITWTRSEELVPAARNLGGISVNPQTGYAVVDASGNPVKVQHYADAQVNKERGVVICSTADPNQLAPGNPALAIGIYHPFDYPFYYFDIRANAENRVVRYFEKTAK